MEEDFRALVLAIPALSGTVGGRVNWGGSPQGVPHPTIVMTVIDDAAGPTYVGPDGLSQARVQVDCWALTYREAKTVSRAVRDGLDGYRGGRFQGVFLISARDGREGGSDEIERPFRVSLDFHIHWRN